ncbi:MAG: PilZ domain-containing protein [Spirochaetaceae bacterium]|jgi:hypothetical protein|nr:PilZ domain-containing protein [Spirochaetaceae bacterium]
MATPVKRVERDFLLNALCNERISITYFRNRIEYSLTIEKVDKSNLYLEVSNPISGLEPKNKVTFVFMYKNIRFSFSSVVTAVQDGHITTDIPEALYKNLDRSYARVNLPDGIIVQCRYIDDSYILPFPVIGEGESSYSDTPAQNSPAVDFSVVLERMASWADSYADGLKMVSFKEKNPTSIEEVLIAEYGKSLFLPEVFKGLPQHDTGTNIVTVDDYMAYLKTHQPTLKDPDEALRQFITDKQNNNITADIWLPLYFYKYIVGCIHLWKKSTSNKLPFDESVLMTARQFACDIVTTMKEGGYFHGGYLKDKIIQGKIVNISALGFCLAYPSSPFSVTLKVRANISVRISAGNRTINTTAQIVRQYHNQEVWFLGCRFIDMIPEDTRFLYESIYGEPFTDTGGILF